VIPEYFLIAPVRHNMVHHSGVLVYPLSLAGGAQWVGYQVSTPGLIPPTCVSTLAGGFAAVIGQGFPQLPDEHLGRFDFSLCPVHIAYLPMLC
jgi:hypothetical protein